MKLRDLFPGLVILLLFGCISAPEVAVSPSVEIENDTPYEIVGLYYAQGNLDNWTGNLLEEEVILPGEKKVLTVPEGALEFVMEINVYGEYYAIAESMDTMAGSTYSWKLNEQSIFGEYIYDPYLYLEPYGYMDYDPYGYME